MCKIVKKKVLLIHRSLGLGGAEKIFAFLANAISESYDTEVLLLTDSANTITLKEGIVVKKKNCYYDKPILRRDLLAGAKELKKMVEVVHAEIEDASPDLIVCFDLRIALVLSILKRKIHVPILFSERADPYANRLYWRIIIRDAYRKFDYIVFQTQQARNFYGKLVESKSCVIANPAIKRTDSVEKNAIQIKEKYLFAAGRLQYRKGFDLLVKAFAKINAHFPEYKLVIYGDGDEKANLEALIEENGIQENVELLPPLNGVIEKNRGASLFVIPSRSEGIPNILIEAMLEEIPSVATDCSPGGARLISDAGQYCLLAENDNVESLARCIETALENPEKMAEMAADAKKSMSRFNESLIKEQWMSVVKKII